MPPTFVKASVVLATIFCLASACSQGGTRNNLPAPLQHETSTSHAVQHYKDLEDLREFNITVGSTLWPVITDEAGRRTGRDSPTSIVLQEIPNSAYGEDSVSGDSVDPMNAGSTSTSRQIQVSQPANGRYKLTLHSAEGGRYMLAFYAYSLDGHPERPVFRSGEIAPATEIHFLIVFTGVPGSTSTLTSTQ